MRSPGFTLVELIVVMVVLGILAAVFIPRSNNPAIIVSTQAEQLAADIRYVQSLAMVQGWSGVSPAVPHHYRVNFTATAYNFTDDFGPVAHPSGTTGSISFAGGVTVTLSNLPNSLVSFDGLGTPYTDSSAGNPLSAVAAISLASGGSTRTVQIFPETGMVRAP